MVNTYKERFLDFVKRSRLRDVLVSNASSKSRLHFALLTSSCIVKFVIFDFSHFSSYRVLMGRVADSEGKYVETSHHANSRGIRVPRVEFKLNFKSLCAISD